MMALLTRLIKTSPRLRRSALTGGRSHALDDVVELRADVRALGRKLQKLGLEVGPPRVFVAVSAC